MNDNPNKSKPPAFNFSEVENIVDPFDQEGDV